MYHMREITEYDALSDALVRYPTWQVKVRASGPGERIQVADQRIWVNPKRGVQYAVAHALAHLDLGHVCHHGGGMFTPQQEQDAHDLATMRIDEEGSRECA